MNFFYKLWYLTQFIISEVLGTQNLICNRQTIRCFSLTEDPGLHETGEDLIACIGWSEPITGGAIDTSIILYHHKCVR